MKLIEDDKPPMPGQTLRYTGKGFPGYIEGLPYMIFISQHNASQYLVQYNGVQMVVNMRYALPLK
jgi:hypothetical protein